MIIKRCLSGPYPTSRNMDLDSKMENLSSSPTTKPPDETTRTIIVYGYPETEEPKVPPPPDLTNTGPVGPIVVRTEEVLIVVFVLILWAAAIALFFNRWGKIRMLEPYQPKFHEEEHRPSCPLNELANPAIAQHRTSLSKYNVTASCLEQPAPLFPTPPPTHRTTNLLRSRQNSVFTGNSSVQLNSMYCPRKTRSAMDINSLVLHENPSAGSRPNSSMLPMSMADRRLSYAQHSGNTMCAVSAALKEKRSCSLFPHGMHDRRRSCMGECSMTSLRDRWAYRDSLSPHLPLACRRTSCAVGGDYLGCTATTSAIVAKDRKPSFNNVLAQVTAERRPSSSMLRISNV